MNGKSVVGSTAAIFDSGTTLIVGDPTGIANLFGAIDGAQSAPQLGEGTYTSAFSNATIQPTRIHIFQYLTLVPCTLNTSISFTVGGKEVSISAASFNRGHVSRGSNLCVAGATANAALTGGELVLRFPS